MRQSDGLSRALVGRVFRTCSGFCRLFDGPSHLARRAIQSPALVLEAVQKKMGGLHNVRTEINHDLEGPGLILECENGIINGSFNEQMKGLDKLFEGVLVGDE